MKKSKVLFFSLILFLCLTPFLFAGGGAEEEQVVLRAAGGFTDLAAQKFKEVVEAKSKGQVTVEIYPAGQLGQIREVLEGLSMGTVDVLFEGLSWMAQYDKDLNFYNQSFMFKDPQELIDSPHQAEILEKIRQGNQGQGSRRQGLYRYVERSGFHRGVGRLVGGLYGSVPECGCRDRP